jgi:hypothetical protein
MNDPVTPTINLRDQARVDTLQIVVKEETPFLPKVAFTLITLASLGGATFTGLGMGLSTFEIAVRWLTLWSLALAGGFLAWRLFYLRSAESEVDQSRLAALTRTAFEQADKVARVVGVIVLAGGFGALVVPTLTQDQALRWSMVAGSLALGLLLLNGISDKRTAWPAVAICTALLLTWAWVDVGGGWQVSIRALHLVAFTLWLGGALWNIAVAMPAGRQHANVDAVLAGARQLDRFRWVVRFALPTIIITGIIMASNFSAAPFSFWVTWPGVLIPLKVLAIIALVVVFITCPLFRHCSPVQGVCDINDLDDNAKS